MANRGLSSDTLLVVVRRRKVVLHTISHLMPTEAWQSPDSTTWEGRRVSSEVRLGNCTQVWGWAKFEERGTHGWGKIVLHTCSDLSKPVRTCPQYSDHVRSSRRVIVLHFRMLLFFGLTSYPGDIAYFNSPNQELSNGVQVMTLYWSKIVDPSRSPCFKTIDRKSLVRRNFLVLCPILLKIAYSILANWQLAMTYSSRSCNKKIVDLSRGAPQSSVERNFSKFSGKN